MKTHGIPSASASGSLNADEEMVLASIDVNKDVDGFHPFNQGRLFTGQAELVSCAVLLYGINRKMWSQRVNMQFLLGIPWI